MLDLRDSILNAFGPFAINFWDDLVNPADTAMLPQYNSGDSTHLTAAGHKVVADRVIQKNIFSGSVLPVSFTSFSAFGPAGKRLYNGRPPRSRISAVTI